MRESTVDASYTDVSHLNYELILQPALAPMPRQLQPAMTILLVGLLLLTTLADASRFSLSPPSNATSSTNLTAPRHLASARTCVQPPNAVNGWYYYSHKFYAKTAKPQICKGTPGHEWSMLNAYVDGGKQGIHWKRTNDENDPACMNNWVYYAKDGITVIVTIEGRTTTLNDKKQRRWCALPVYQVDGKQGKQWEYCTCSPDVEPMIPPANGETCSRPANSVTKWQWRDWRSSKYFNCTAEHNQEGRMWTMLNAYQSGGSRNYHWKYMEMRDNDGQCLEDWTYYARDGVTVIAQIQGTVTKIGDKKNQQWCPLKVSRVGTAHGTTWDYCSCP